MKLIIAGASGFVATEILRQSLRQREITAVVALARRPVAAPPGTDAADASKLRSVVIDDYEAYPDSVRRELAGADACIWTVAITPTKSKLVAFEEVTRICQTCTVAGLRAIVESGPAKPFRFLYMSGLTSERDQTKTGGIFGNYLRMRGETENQVLAFAAGSKPIGSVEACVAKPGLVTANSTIARSAWGTVLRWTNAAPNLSTEELAAALIQQAKAGFDKEPLLNDDLRRIGQEALGRGLDEH